MQKDQYWQKIRGICILAVVWIHASGFSNELNYNSFNGIYFFVIRNLLSFPVPVLFFLAGYYTKKCNNWVVFLKKRLVRIGIPYLIFSMCYMLFQILLYARIGDVVDMKNYLIKVPRILLLGEAATPFYYSIVLLIFTLITPLLYSIMDTAHYKIPFYISGVFVLLLYYYQLTGNEMVRFFPLTPIWLCFYYYGIITKTKKHITFGGNMLAILCAISILLMLMESWTLIKFTNTGAFAYSQMRISAFLYAGAIIQYCIQKYKIDYIQTPLSTLGDLSYGIYSIHCFWMQFFWIAYEKNHNFQKCLLVIVQGGEVFITLFLSIITIIILHNLFKQKSKMLFGI